MSHKRNNELVNEVNNIFASEAYQSLPLEDRRTLNSLLASYEDVTYKEWDDRHHFYRMMVSNMVNDCGFRDDELAEKMANDHPTLQQNFFRLCVKFIRNMAKKGYYDGRNESSVKLSQKIVSEVLGEASYIPFV